MINIEYFNNKDNSTFRKGLNRFLRNFSYLLMSLPFGIIYFTFAISGISIGAALSITYIGIPILVITLICAERIVEIEKDIARKILNISIEKGVESVDLNGNEGLIKKMINVIKDLKKWKSTFYCIIKLPISVMHFSVVTCSMALSLGITFQPVVFEVSKSFGVDVYKNSITIGKLIGFENPNYVDLFICPILGILITSISVKIINALAKKWAEFTLEF